MQEPWLSLLNNKFEFLRTLADVSMNWWVSGVVFCASFLAAVWLKRDKIAPSAVFPWLRWGLTYFFASIVAYGIVAMWMVRRLESEARRILSQLKLADAQIGALSEFDTVFYALGLGTTSFVIVLAGWIVLCRAIKP
jgi:hypothetical protein